MSKELLGLYRDEIFELTVDREAPPIRRDFYRFYDIIEECVDTELKEGDEIRITTKTVTNNPLTIVLTVSIQNKNYYYLLTDPTRDKEIKVEGLSSFRVFEYKKINI